MIDKDWIKNLLSLAPEERTEFKQIFEVWNNQWDEWQMWGSVLNKLQAKYGEKQWYEQKICRYLNKLVNWQLLLKKEERYESILHTYYKPNPGKLGRMLGALSIAHLEEILKAGLGEELDVLTHGRPPCTTLSGPAIGGSYLHLYPNPFWEYNIHTAILGFPQEENLLPAERVILNHIVKNLENYLEWLGWLRAKHLVRRHLKVQLPLVEDLRRVLIESDMDEGKINEAKALSTLSHQRLERKARKKFGPDFTLPEPTSIVKCPSIWSLLLNLRQKGYANNLACIVATGPYRIALTDEGLCLNTDDEKAPPLPPLTLPRNLEYEKLQAQILVKMTDNIGLPSFKVYNPTPFAIKPQLEISGYKYTIQPVKDFTTIRKLERGELPSRQFMVFEFNEIRK